MNRARNIPVLAVTANAVINDSHRARDTGFDGYDSKPIDVKLFDELLQRMLRADEATGLKLRSQ